MFIPYKETCGIVAYGNYVYTVISTLDGTKVFLKLDTKVNASTHDIVVFKSDTPDSVVRTLAHFFFPVISQKQLLLKRGGTCDLVNISEDGERLFFWEKKTLWTYAVTGNSRDVAHIFITLDTQGFKEILPIFFL